MKPTLGVMARCTIVCPLCAPASHQLSMYLYLVLALSNASARQVALIHCLNGHLDLEVMHDRPPPLLVPVSAKPSLDEIALGFLDFESTV